MDLFSKLIKLETKSNALSILLLFLLVLDNVLSVFLFLWVLTLWGRGVKLEEFKELLLVLLLLVIELILGSREIVLGFRFDLLGSRDVLGWLGVLVIFIEWFRVLVKLLDIKDSSS